MANYNYGYGGQGQGFSGFSVNPWVQAMQQIPQNFNQFQQGMYNQNPNLAMDSFMRTIRTSNTNEDLMKRMLPSLNNQWVQQQMTDAQNGTGTLKPFSSMLSEYNWDKEMARYAPEFRRESASMFQRPVRTVSF